MSHADGGVESLHIFTHFHFPKKKKKKLSEII